MDRERERGRKKGEEEREWRQLGSRGELTVKNNERIIDNKKKLEESKGIGGK